MAVEWKTPKTDWTSSSRFNLSDYNRIKNNLQWLYNKVCELYKKFSIVDMGEDIESYGENWNVAFFNAWEQNLDTINANMFVQDYGKRRTFFANGPFIPAEDLNRIESATLKMKEILERQEAGLRRIPFRLGTFREVRI